MLVKAKCNVKDSSGWHVAGDIFETEADFGDNVEVLLEAEKHEHTGPAMEPEKEPEKESAKTKAPSRRKAASK